VCYARRVAQQSDEGFRVTDRRKRDTADPPPPARETTVLPSAPTASAGRAAESTQRTLVGLFMMLASEALIALGDAPDPATGQRQRELAHASSVIDLLTLLREKTEGNRSAQESQALDDLIYDLQIRYVEAAKSSQ
jgi:Domain of unknown function (DUF1844)